jgi:hypothetical protein
VDAPGISPGRLGQPIAPGLSASDGPHLRTGQDRGCKQRRHRPADHHRTAGEHGGVAFRNYLACKYGGQEVSRPQDVQAALDESLTIIQRLLGAQRQAPLRAR